MLLINRYLPLPAVLHLACPFTDSVQFQLHSLDPNAQFLGPWNVGCSSNGTVKIFISCFSSSHVGPMVLSGSKDL